MRMLIWRTGENGQLGHNIQDSGKQTQIHGKFTNAHETDAGNGQKLQKKLLQIQDDTYGYMETNGEKEIRRKHGG